MKIVLFLLIFIPAYVFADHQIQFQDLDYTQALAKSKTENKPVFLMLYATWCDHCKYMKEQVFTDSSVAEFFNQHFICIKKDAEQGEGVKLGDQFAIKSFPTLIWLDGNGTTLYRIVGQWTVEDFLVQAKDATDSTLQFPYLKRQFEADKSNPDKCYPYIRALRRANMDVQEVANEYFATQRDNQLISDMNWKILANGEFDLTSREFKFLVAHQKEYADITSQQRVEKKLTGTVAEVLNPYINKGDTAGYFKMRKGAADIHHPKVDSLLFTMDALLYESKGDWNGYQRVTLPSVQKYVWNDYVQLKNICDNYQKHISDPKALATAVDWAKRSAQLHEDYSTLLLCAKVMQKSGDKQGSMKIAQQAQDLAIKNGWDHNEVDQLLKQMQ